MSGIVPQRNYTGGNMQSGLKKRDPDTESSGKIRMLDCFFPYLRWKILLQVIFLCTI